MKKIKAKLWINGYWRNRLRLNNKPRKWVHGYYKIITLKIHASKSYKK